MRLPQSELSLIMPPRSGPRFGLTEEPIQRPAGHSVIGENGGQGEHHSDLRCELCAQAVSGAKVVDRRHAFPVMAVAGHRRRTLFRGCLSEAGGSILSLSLPYLPSRARVAASKRQQRRNASFQRFRFSERGDFVRNDYSPLDCYCGSHLCGHYFSRARSGGAVCY